MPSSNSPKLLLLTALATALPAIASAQQTSGGSTYSVFNIGDLPVSTSAAGTGRAGVEVATPSPMTLNSVNPAGWSDLRFVTVEASLVYEQYKVSDNQSSIFQNNTKLQGFGAAFPYSPSLGGTIALAFRPYSNVNYRTQVEQEVPKIDSGTARELTTYQGRGGLSEMMIGTSIRPFDWLAVGVTASRYFGTIESESQIAFPDNDMTPATYRGVNQHGGWGARIGLRLEPTEDLHLGAVVETGAKITRDRLQISDFTQQGSAVNDTTALDTSTFRIPPRISVGAAYRTGRFLLAADGSTQLWDNSDFPTARTSTRVAASFERLPNESPSATGFERWTFRGGLYYDQSYYSLDNGNIDQYGLSLGAGIPLTRISGLNANTRLDLAAEVGRRGSLTNGLTQETYFRLFVELSISELWFVRSKR
jgi:hypothetical protein